MKLKISLIPSRAQKMCCNGKEDEIEIGAPSLNPSLEMTSKSSYLNTF